MRASPTFVVLVTIASLGLAACGSDRAGPSAVVRDSAGITIVVNPDRGLWSEGERWELVEELRIGVAAGDPELQFGQIGGLDADDAGRIYVLDQQASRVRVFGPEGAFLEAFGGQGQGPGELSQATGGVFVTPDGTILVPDLMNQRLTRYGRGGQPLPEVALDLTRGIPILWMAAADRTLFQQLRRMTFPGMPGTGEEPMDLILTRGPDGEVTDTVATLPVGESFGAGAGGAPEVRIFAPETVWTVLSDGRLVTGRNSDYALEIRDGSGQVRTIVRKDVPRRPVTAADQDGFRRAMARAWEEFGMPQEALAQMTAMVQFAETWPALAAITAGPEGTLWVQWVDTEAALDISDLSDLQNLQMGSPRWDVFDGEGRYLGVVEMPRDFTPRRFLGEHVYGVHTDDLGVQRVVRLRVVQGG